MNFCLLQGGPNDFLSRYFRDGGFRKKFPRRVTGVSGNIQRCSKGFQGNFNEIMGISRALQGILMAFQAIQEFSGGISGCFKKFQGVLESLEPLKRP